MTDEEVHWPACSIKRQARPFPRTPNQLTTIKAHLLLLRSWGFDLDPNLHLHEPHISYQRTLNGALQRLEWRHKLSFSNKRPLLYTYLCCRICITALLLQSRMGRRIRSANTSRWISNRCQCTNSSISTVYRIGFNSNIWRMLSKKRKQFSAYWKVRFSCGGEKQVKSLTFTTLLRAKRAKIIEFSRH